MERKSLVSIIINCYNGEKYLRETIDSVITQTYTNWEIIFWDNQSTDSTAEIVKSYNDDRIKYFYASEHTSLGEARNLAMEQANGEYIGFLDADDLWSEHKLSKQINVLTGGNVSCVYTYYKTFGDVVVPKIIGSKSGVRDLVSLLDNYDIAISSAIFKRNIIQDNKISFNKNYQLIEDLDFFISIAYHTHFYLLDEVLTFYRVYPNSLSMQKHSWHIEYERFIRETTLRLSQKGYQDIQRIMKSINQRYRHRCYSDALQCGEYTQALKAIMYLSSFRDMISAFVRLLLGRNLSHIIKKIICKMKIR